MRDIPFAFRAANSALCPWNPKRFAKAGAIHDAARRPVQWNLRWLPANAYDAGTMRLCCVAGRHVFQQAVNGCHY
jgi:hypothetical protein